MRWELRIPFVCTQELLVSLRIGRECWDSQRGYRGDLYRRCKFDLLCPWTEKFECPRPFPLSISSTDHFPSQTDRGKNKLISSRSLFVLEMTTKTFSVRVTNKNALVSHTQLSEGVAADDG